MSVRTSDPREVTGQTTDYLGLFLICSILLVATWVAQWDPAGSEAIVLTASGHLTGCDVPFQSHHLFFFLCLPLLAGAFAGLAGFIHAVLGTDDRGA